MAAAGSSCIAADRKPVSARIASYAAIAARVLAFWFGAFSILNVVAALRNPVFDENIWWIDLRFLPGALEQVLLASAGVLLIAAAVRRPAKGLRRWATLGAFAVLCAGALADSVNFYKLWANHSFDPLVPVPLSLLIGVVLALVCWQLLRRQPAGAPSRGKFIATAAAVSVVFMAVAPLAQMIFFGTTDYRRHADAIVVLGADVHPDGSPSLSLQDRMSTAIDLYRRGLAPVLIASGGVEPDGQDEAAVMRQMAIDGGVPSSAIVMDDNGVNTDATVADTTKLMAERNLDSTMVVSHFYHLPRVKLAFQAAGEDVLTVPSRSTAIPQLPYLIAREIPAFWVYYGRAVFG